MSIIQSVALTSIRSRLDESGTSSGLWTDAQLRGYLNEGLREASRRGRCLRDEEAIATTGANPVITAPATMIAVAGDTVWWTDATTTPATALVTFNPRYSLTYRDRVALSREWGFQQDYVGQPLFWTMWGGATQLTASTTQKIQMYPCPSASGCLIVPFYRFAVELATDTSQAGVALDLPNGWEDCAIDWACYRACLQSRDPALASIYRNDFELHLGELQSNSARYTDAPGEIIPSVWAAGGADFGGFGF